jgi:hypothetical protein
MPSSPRALSAPRWLAPSALARGLIASTALFGGEAAVGEWKTEPVPGLELRGTLQLGAAAIAQENANFGRGRVHFLTGKTTGDPVWGELHIEPGLAFTHNAGVYGEVSVVGARTFGNGDPAGFASGGDGKFDVDNAVLGWRSGDPNDDMAHPIVDFSLGRQTVDVGDGFLIDDGNFDFGNESGVWLLPRQSFQRTLRARLDYRAWYADAFFLEADPDNEEPALAGGNLEYQLAGGGHIGLLGFHILDADRPVLFGARDGMNVISARINDLRLRQLPQVGWWGEATRQFGDGRFGRIDSSAWYAEAIYHFDEWPWQPRLSYRFAYFSGDADPFDATRRDFDPLFYGFDKRGWGTWFQGEVTGGWLLFNNNQRNHLARLTFAPHARFTWGLIGATFELVEDNYRGVPVATRHFSDEFNIFADWLITDQVFITGAYAVAFPGVGAAQAIGDDDPFHVLEIGVYVTY